MQSRFSLILCLALCLVLLASTGCALVQKPISDDEGVVLFLNQVEEQAAQGQWKDAARSADQLEASWNRDRDRLTTPRTQRSVENFEDSLEELKKEVDEQDKQDVMEEISALKDYYRDITEP